MTFAMFKRNWLLVPILSLSFFFLSGCTQFSLLNNKPEVHVPVIDHPLCKCGDRTPYQVNLSQKWQSPKCDTVCD